MSNWQGFTFHIVSLLLNLLSLRTASGGSTSVITPLDIMADMLPSNAKIHSSTPPGTGLRLYVLPPRHCTVPSHQFQLAFHTAPVYIPKVRIAT